MAALYMTPSPLGSARNPSDEQANGNTSPLFAMVNSKLMRRNDLNNLSDYSWTSSWWGWSTLQLLLRKYKAPHPQFYPFPPSTAPAVDSEGWQSTLSDRPDWIGVTRVRYAVSFVTQFYESDPGPWCEYVNVGSDQTCPTLTGIPIGPNGTLGRRIFRQFEGEWYSNIGQLKDNTTTTFIDDQLVLKDR